LTVLYGMSDPYSRTCSRFSPSPAETQSCWSARVLFFFPSGARFGWTFDWRIFFLLFPSFFFVVEIYPSLAYLSFMTGQIPLPSFFKVPRPSPSFSFLPAAARKPTLFDLSGQYFSRYQPPCSPRRRPSVLWPLPSAHFSPPPDGGTNSSLTLTVSPWIEFLTSRLSSYPAFIPLSFSKPWLSLLPLSRPLKERGSLLDYGFFEFLSLPPSPFPLNSTCHPTPPLIPCYETSRLLAPFLSYFYSLVLSTRNLLFFSVLPGRLSP